MMMQAFETIFDYMVMNRFLLVLLRLLQFPPRLPPLPLPPVTKQGLNSPVWHRIGKGEFWP